MKLYLIRHGKTKGNQEYRYVGRTDESILPAEAERLSACGWKRAIENAPERLYVSPMLRCRETAAIVFPGLEQRIVPDLRECDFGTFEYHNYQELSGDPVYQQYIDSNGETPFPGGEDKKRFSERCVKAFSKVLEELSGTGRDMTADAVAFVVHGGTIMAILEAFSEPHRSYFDWQVKNGCGYEADWDPNEGKLRNIRYLNAEPETEG